MPANPLTTRSRVVLEIASEMVGGPDPIFKQSKVSFRSQGGREWSRNLYGSSTYEMLDTVISGEALLAMMNPASLLAVAHLGKGPYASPQPVRVITVIPSEDQMVFAVRPETGLKTFEEVAAKRAKLRLGLRGQLDHGLQPMLKDVMDAVGFTLADFKSWGGDARHDGNIPFPNGAKFAAFVKGELDAVIDEASNAWVGQALDAGMTILTLTEPTVKRLEAMGHRRAYIRKKDYPKLAADVLTIDFSGWPVFVRADLADDTVTQICAGLDARKQNIPWEGEGPLPVERMCLEAPDTPQVIPLHPAAERFWRAKGYIR